MFGDCPGLEEVAFGPNLVTIGHHAFSECVALKALTLPDSVQTIGINAFYHDKVLASVSFGTQLTLIDKYAFANCPGLRTVSFAASDIPILTISSYAFSGDTLLSTVTFSGALSSLESNAFRGDSLVRKLTFPSTVWSVGKNVFSQMGSVREVTFEGLPPSGLVASGLPADTKIRCNEEYKDEWTEVIASCGFTNVEWFDGSSIQPTPGPTPVDNVRYAIADAQADRAIASVTVNSNCEIGQFVLVDGRVYDSVLYIKNTAETDVKLTLPTGYDYRALKGTTPLTIPAGTENILTITRIEDKAFLVSREELVAIQ